ncbi:hypothetical protein GPDM_09815 [Planococcus donghaensis MPA1U2]|uniref:LysM domain-containing protein n=1 Tax=Planococcus donghaensis MPA1U2 TaxID=933115 RepID=E7RH79_9BACL|nr:LysM peptidoglycan-binding domain-containing protein [Planococcus donghaensis]EGA89584.1 hypothetical protein GPDM_09815 [Planococcus donghaensis MPA1U2]
MTIIRQNSYLILFFALIMVFTFYVILTHNTNSVQTSQVKIEEGDTLWTLAESFSGSTPHHEWIEEIMKENNLSTAKIIAGQSLKIPSEQLNFSPDETRIFAGDSE